MSKVAIITGATGGLGKEFTRVINSYGDIKILDDNKI